MPNPIPNPKLLTARLLQDRYSISEQTVNRWVEAGILPKPIKINRLRFWSTASLEIFERNLAKTSSSSP